MRKRPVKKPFKNPPRLLKILLYLSLLTALSLLSVLFSPLIEKSAESFVRKLSQDENFSDKIFMREFPLFSAYSYAGGLSDARLMNTSFAPAAGNDDSDIISELSAVPSEAAFLLSLKPITAITIAPVSSVGYEQHDGVYIKNETNYDIDVQASLAKNIDINMSDKNASVLILHTHGSESYSVPDKTYYTSFDKDRSADNSQNVIAVGSKLADALTKKGLKVIHIKDIFDYPEYDGAYNRALNAISEQIKKNPSVKIIIDLHRDSMVTTSGEKYKTVADINGRPAAQIMFVCGSNQGALPHSNWQQNLRLAIRLQQKINKIYPNLMRPINLRTARFNQHASSGSMLVEMGTSGNTLDEALYSAELFGNTLADFLKTL